jgi:branched-chain amino acid transport system ATP-binding protein
MKQKGQRILEGEGIEKYFGGLAAASDVDFLINRGEIIGLIGPNGAGKTTLFNLISGSFSPSSGRILFKGEDITGMRPHQICKRGLARTFQLVKLFGNMTVLENVWLACSFRKSPDINKYEAKKEPLELLEFVGLSGMEGIIAKELTIANQKRLEVARALATNPELLLLDELMAGLNPTEVTQAIDLIMKIRKRGITIFMIEHVMKAIMNVSDRIIVLHYGKKICEGPPSEIAQNKTVREIYLGI